MRTATPSSRSAIRAVAQVGNAVALFAILLALANSAFLFSPTAHPPPSTSKAPTASRVLLIIVDGLRADAVTPSQMPNVHALAQRGAYRESYVDALIPSTIAGLRALIEGVVVPPADFVSDFRSRQALRGGLVEAVATSGGQVFAAGPHLWSDLYKQWLTGNVSVFGLARDDPTVLRAARAACADSRWTLVIAQFCRPDVMAHMHGALSPEYSASVAWCDRAIGELVRKAGDDTLVVITSDHGVTRMGGHAGAERDVLKTPLVLSQPAVAADLPEQIRQTDVPHLVAGALRVHMPVLNAHYATPPLWYHTLLSLAAAMLGGLAVLALLRTATNDDPPKAGAFWLNTSVWISLIIAWLNPWAACIVLIVALLILAWIFGARPSRLPLLSFVAGIVLGVVRVGIPWLTEGSGRSAHSSWWLLGAGCIAAILIGRAAARYADHTSASHMIWLGAVIVVIAPALSGLLGESVSLSTLDVRLAFRAIESPLGLTGAVLVASLQPFLPMLSLLAGAIWWWRKRGTPIGSIAAFGTGAGAVIAGELALAATTLASAASKPLAALSLGLLLRECALVLVLFPALVAAIICLRRRAELCHKTREA